MRYRFQFLASLSVMSMTVFASTDCFADNPIIQTKFTADPAPMVYGDTLYLYTSHDEDDATGFTMYNWMLYSTTDMVNWTDHGIIGGVKDPYKTFKWADGNNAWAPQVIFRNNKFYLYGPFPRNGHMVIGVAVADKPTGPFVDALGAPLIYNASSSNDIDPTVFIDDDGQAYLYWGHQPPVFYVKLNEDMISYSGGIQQVTRPNTYEEGPWFYKRNNHYYLAFASTCCPEGIGYAMSDSATGPWTFKGSIMDGNSASSGNHPGIVDYKGTSYVFGFNYALNFALTTVHRERRSICVEKLSYNTDGTIPKLPFWSTTGAAQVGTLNPYVKTEAETIAWSQGLATEVCSEGGMDVTSIENGDFIKVKGVDFGSGATSFDARVASAGSGGTIEIRLDSQTGKLVGSCAVSGTGGAQTWTTKSCPVSGASGIHDLYFVFTGGSASLFNFNWWKFSGGDVAVDAGSTDATVSDATIATGGAGGSGAGGALTGGAGAGGSATPGAGGSAAGGSAAGGSRTGGTTAASGGAAGGRSAVGSGGRNGSGGASTGTGGVASSGGSNSSPTSKGSGSGCSCNVGSHSPAAGVWLALLGGAVLFSLRRRQR